MSDITQVRHHLTVIAARMGHHFGPVCRQGGDIYTASCSRCLGGWTGPGSEIEQTPCIPHHLAKQGNLRCVVPGCENKATHAVSWYYRKNRQAELTHGCDQHSKALLDAAYGNSNFRTPAVTRISPQRQKSLDTAAAHSADDAELWRRNPNYSEWAKRRDAAEPSGEFGRYRFADDPGEDFTAKSTQDQCPSCRRHFGNDSYGDICPHCKDQFIGFPAGTYHEHRDSHEPVGLLDRMPPMSEHPHSPGLYMHVRNQSHGPEGDNSQGPKMRDYHRFKDITGEQPPGTPNLTPWEGWRDNLPTDKPEGWENSMSGTEWPPSLRPSLNALDPRLAAGFSNFKDAVDSLLDRAKSQGHHPKVAWGTSIKDNMIKSQETHTIKCKTCHAKDTISKTHFGHWKVTMGPLSNEPCSFPATATKKVGRESDQGGCDYCKGTGTLPQSGRTCPYCEGTGTEVVDPLAETHHITEDYLKQRRTSLRTVAHDSGDGETIYHCPFCGSGQVTARSDRTIECDFCHTCFTVQVQPELPAFPQTINGMPVAVPGMPGEAGVDPMAQTDPNAGAGIPGDIDAEAPGDEMMDPDDLADEGEDEAAGEEQGDEGDEMAQPPAGGPGFAGKPSADNQPPWLKNKKSFRTAAGAELTEDKYANHLALKHAEDEAAALAAVRAGR